MIIGLEIKNFKAIRFLPKLEMSQFHVLVGPNGSAKSTFLEAIEFVHDCLIVGPRGAVEQRSVGSFEDLTWMREGGSVEIRIWLDLEWSHPETGFSIFEYSLSIGREESFGICVKSEELRQLPNPRSPWELSFTKTSTKHQRRSKSGKRLLGKTSNKTDVYVRETSSYQDTFNFGMDKLTLALTPPDEERYPSANAVKRFLMQGVRFIQLNSRAMRLPCPATRGTDLELDGTNLARAVGKLIVDASSETDTIRWSTDTNCPVTRWADHLKYALPDLDSIGWSRRRADNAEYLILKYKNGLEAPSWLLSDGTLRMLALTLPAFLPPTSGIFMVEEPENGVHPKALEIILRSLSAIPGGQMLVATHSPLVVEQVGIDPLLCFVREADGARIIPGREHPALKGWDGTPDLGLVYAAGVLE
jgi:predicted ATPase